MATTQFELKSGHQTSVVPYPTDNIIVYWHMSISCQYTTLEGEREYKHTLGPRSYCHGQNRKVFFMNRVSTKLDQQISVLPSYRNSHAHAIPLYRIYVMLLVLHSVV